MKLLQELEEQIKELGPLRKAWFTTFNLNLDFFERHVLSTLLEMDKPRNRIDFELMQQRLNGKITNAGKGQKIRFEDKVDVKVFADQRMYDAGDLKRTAIDVIAINPTQLDVQHVFGTTTLFHPKVIYLEDIDGQAILGTGSANLTLSGWSRNQEVFTFRKVASQQQQASLYSFFLPLMSGDTDSDIKLATKLWKDEDVSWRFVHSLAGKSFLTELYSGYEPSNQHDLAVWSPYFPLDLPQFIKRLNVEIAKQTGCVLPLVLHIVPDRVENKQIRTQWHEAFIELQANKTLAFYNNALKKHELSELCHAKVWMTPTKLAIGSWNFTTPGSNLLLGKDEHGVNIEAGFIFEHCENFDEQLGRAFTANSSDFMTASRLAEHSLEIPALLPFEVKVSFDWGRLSYIVEVGGVDDPSIFLGYTLKLPDIDEPLMLAGLPSFFTACIEDPKALLVQHTYEIIQGASLAYRGFILEKQAELRRVEQFSTLDDIFTSLISGADLDSNPNTILRNEFRQTDQDSTEEVDGLVVSTEQHRASHSFFRMFQALAEFEIRLDEVMSDCVLVQYAFVVPGCLAELKEKIAKQLEEHTNVFAWFMTQEFNLLVTHLAKKIEDSELQSRVHGLIIKYEQDHEHGQLGSARYRNLVNKKCGYGKH